MKLLTLALMISAAAPAFASLNPAYVSGNIVSIEQVASSGARANTYKITYWVQPCAQKFTKVQEIRVPEIELYPNRDLHAVTNTSLVVVLHDSGIQCMGPTMQESTFFEASADAVNPQALKPSNY